MAILHEIESISVYYDEIWRKAVRERFCRKQEDVGKKDNLFFSQYWQGFAWSAIIGFLNNRRIQLDTKTKDSSFKFSVIIRGSSLIADSLILMAIAKSGMGYELLEKPSDLVTIISEYATGGATIINEIRETPGKENTYNFPDDYLSEIEDRIKS